jgi:hypothetical protein
MALCMRKPGLGVGSTTTRLGSCGYLNLQSNSLRTNDGDEDEAFLDTSSMICEGWSEDGSVDMDGGIEFDMDEGYGSVLDDKLSPFLKNSRKVTQGGAKNKQRNQQILRTNLKFNERLDQRRNHRLDRKSVFKFISIDNEESPWCCRYLETNPYRLRIGHFRRLVAERRKIKDLRRVRLMSGTRFLHDDNISAVGLGPNRIFYWITDSISLKSDLMSR